MNLLSWWKEWRASRAEHDAVLEEMQFHVERETERNIANGMSPDEARRAAVLAFGGVERFREVSRSERSGNWLDDFLQDARFAVRVLMRAPLFTTVAVMSLGLGIGANTAVFSMVKGILLSPLAYPAADRLMMISVRPNDHPETRGGLSVADFEAMPSVHGFESVGSASFLPGGVALSGIGDAEQVNASAITSGIFRALRTPAQLGRTIQPEDDRPGSPRVVVLSDEFWRDRLGSDPNVIGRALQLDARTHTVIGVMPPGFTIPGYGRDRLWPVLQLDPAQFRAPFYLRVIARRANDVNDAVLSTELARVETEVKQRWSGSPPHWRYGSESLKAAVVGESRTTLLLLFGAVGLVLLIATANVANLLLARLSTRAPELALRISLGAARSRLIRQLLTESVLLSIAGGLLGVIVAYVSLHAILSSSIVADLPRVEDIRIDAVVLGSTFLLTLIIGALVGLAPALKLSAEDLALRVREGGRAVIGRGHARLRQSLVVLEFALALVVIVGAGLLEHTIMRLQEVDTGIGAEHLLAVRVTAPEAKYPQAEQLGQFYESFEERLKSLPGVSAVGTSMALPPARVVMRNPFTPQGKVFATNESAPLAVEVLISPGYFSAIGAPLLRGRNFTPADRDSIAQQVAIVDATLAERYLGGVEQAVGKWIQTGDPDPTTAKLEVVGVVRNVKYSGLNQRDEPTIYVPYRQNLWWRTMYVVMRTNRAESNLIAAVRREIAGIDSNVPIMESFTLEQLHHDAMGRPRFRAQLFGAFGVLALVLASAGIYGLMSYSVTQRRREYGLRLALGARPVDILRDTLAAGLRVAAFGVAAGLVAAFALAHTARSVLFGVSAIDVPVFLLTAAVMGLVGVLATAIPAARAASTNPAVALLEE